MNITAAILHRIDKVENTSGPDSATVTPRNTPLAVNSKLIETATEVARIYGKAINGYGTFNGDTTVHPFSTLLRGYIDTQDNVENAFVELTVKVAKLIANSMSSAQFARGGYVLFLRYSAQGQEWFLIVMLKLKAGTGIDEDTLELTDSLSFDIDHIREAARIDVNKWTADTQPYLSFIKRSAGDDVTRYFRLALGCTEYTDSKHNTKSMLEAVRAFCEAKSLASEAANEVRRRVYEHCEEKDRNGQPVNLIALSAIIFDQEPRAFIDYVRDNDYEIGETFEPNKRLYARFKRIDAKVGNVKVSFDVDDFLQNRVDYDAERNCLIVNSLPRPLVDQLLQIKPRNDPADQSS